MIERDAINRIHDKKRKSDRIDRNIVRVWKVTDDFAAGVPDCIYLNRVRFQASPLFIEYKYLKELPKRNTTIIVPKWHSAEQQSWINELHESGNSTLVIIAFGEGAKAGAIILYDGEWNDGITTAEARRRAIKLNSCATIISRIVTNDGEITNFIKTFEGNFN